MRCHANPDDIAAALVEISDKGFVGRQAAMDARENIVLNAADPIHSKALEILGQYTAKQRAELLRAATFVAAFQNKDGAVLENTSQSETKEPSHSATMKGAVPQEEDSKKEEAEKVTLKIDPNLKSLRGLL